MNVLLHTFGSAGDILPTLRIAAALKHAGHTTRVLTNAHYADLANKRGIEAIGVGPPYDPAAITPTNARAWARSTAVLTEHIIPHAEHAYRALLEHLDREGADILVGHHTSFAVPWAAAEAGLPFVTLCTAPSSWPSTHDPNRYPGMPDLDRYPRPMTRIGNRIGTWATCRAVDPPTNAVRTSLGLPNSTRFLFDDMLSGARTLGLWSPTWRASSDDDPPHSAVTGFAFDQPTPLDPVLEEFLAAHPGPVAVTLGTTAAHAGEREYHEAATACAALDLPCILLLGSQAAVQEFRPLPAHSIALAAAPHSGLFPRVRAVIHHGGMGTTAEALRAGTPQLIIPFAHDQFDNARRCRLHGCALTVERSRVRAGLKPALHRLVRETTFADRARTLAQPIDAEQGAVRAAEQIIDAID